MEKIGSRLEMDANVIKVEHKKCICCMETHDVKTIQFKDKTLYDGVLVEYEVESFYCELADEFYDDEQMVALNNRNLKDAYRKEVGFLTSTELKEIRLQIEASSV